jgi:hypothetical protein
VVRFARRQPLSTLDWDWRVHGGTGRSMRWSCFPEQRSRPANPIRPDNTCYSSRPAGRLFLFVFILWDSSAVQLSFQC